MKNRWLTLSLLTAAVLVVAACTEIPSDPPPTAPPITDPPVTATTDSASSTSSPGTSSATTTNVETTTTGLPTTVPGPLFVFVPDVFAQDAVTAVELLEEAGFAVIAYEVCSGSVAEGEVRQVVAVNDDGDEIELVGTAGTTDAGSAVPFGSTVEVKIGTGTACG